MRNGGSTTTNNITTTESTAPLARMKKGPWTPAEDAILIEYVRKHGEGNWNAVQKNSGLQRCGKSCRLRWANHLRPNLKKGAFSPDEELLILHLHSQLGNKWARMAAHLPGRTDNEIKNYWNTRIKRRQRAGLPLYPPELQLHAAFHGQQHRLFPGASPPSPVTLFHTSPEIHRIKRHSNDGLGFHLSFPSSPSPLYQTAPAHPEHPCIIRNFDLGQIPFSAAKMELPSTQLFPESTGSSLLDAMLQEEADRKDALEPELGIGRRRGSSPHGESANKCKLKRERPDEEPKTVSEDLASLLDMISTVMPASATNVISGWCNDVDSGEQSNSNEPSSVITDAEEFSLEMQQLTSSLSAASEEGGEDWSLGSCPWDNMR